MTTKNLLLSEELVNYLVSVPRLFVRSLMIIKLNIIKLYPDKEGLINQLSKKCVILIALMTKYQHIKKKIISIPEFLLKNNRTILIDNLSTSDQKTLNILHLHLFKISALELISKKEDYKPFWTPAFKELSERLSLPIEIGCVDLDSSSSNPLLKNQEGLSQLLMTNSIKVQNKNCLKTSSQLYKYTVANNPLKEDIPLKSLKVKITPTKKQLLILNEWFSTCNYLYNKTISLVKNGQVSSFDSIKLRDMLVTKDTKKNNPEYIQMSSEILDIYDKLKIARKLKNETDITSLQNVIKQKNVELRNLAKTLPSENNKNVSDWQIRTPKKIRSDAVDDVCKAYKSAIGNLKAGNINKFSVGYRKRINNTSLSISDICLKDNQIKLVSRPIKDHDNINDDKNKYTDMGFNVSKQVINKLENIDIKTVRLTRKRGLYYIMIPVPVNKETSCNKDIKYCGIDPGSRTFLTSFGNSGAVEYKFDTNAINKIDKKISLLKNKQLIRPMPHSKDHKRPIRKKVFNKLENKKANCIDELHWKSIKHILDNNDIVFIGDIKSHDIVKNKEHQQKLNRDINNLKFYVFKQRLLYKSVVRNKHTFLIPEQHTTKTCSCCGIINSPGRSETYHCLGCKTTMGRDLNAAKNILMKGLIKLDIR